MLVCVVGSLLAPTSRALSPVSENSGAFEDDSKSSEYRAKAAFLYNFMRYSKWPEGSFEKDDSPIILTVIGKDPFGKVLEQTFEDETIGKRAIQVRRSREVPKKIEGHMLFCGGLSKKERAQLLERCHKQPVLLIGELEGFAESGGSINFYIDKRKIRFEINTDALAASGVSISSQLLKLAKIVKTKKKGGEEL